MDTIVAISTEVRNWWDWDCANEWKRFNQNIGKNISTEN